jgi:hypothetical protein
MKYEDRKAIFMKKAEERKSNTIKEFIDDVDKIHVTTAVYKMVSVLRNETTKYINYHITQFPNCSEYSITMRKHEYPFNVYYEKKWHKNDIPAKYIEEFRKLENYLKSLENLEII